ncbi:MAG: hypothetical protein M4579_003387 [Chaenotheca gracillima]|nr:MAG: hypothetical protein M4579_003387 [Chaenotheca gracillima]
MESCLIADPFDVDQIEKLSQLSPAMSALRNEQLYLLATQRTQHEKLSKCQSEILKIEGTIESPETSAKRLKRLKKDRKFLKRSFRGATHQLAAIADGLERINAALADDQTKSSSPPSRFQSGGYFHQSSASVSTLSTIHETPRPTLYSEQSCDSTELQFPVSTESYPLQSSCPSTMVQQQAWPTYAFNYWDAYGYPNRSHVLTVPYYAAASPDGSIINYFYASPTPISTIGPNPFIPLGNPIGMPSAWSYAPPASFPHLGPSSADPSWSPGSPKRRHRQSHRSDKGSGGCSKSL